MASREELSEQLGELKPALQRTLAHERATVEGAGKPWDMFGWLVGNPIDQRYPTGPAYHALPGTPTFLGLTAAISLKDWGYTAASTGFLYMWGYRYNVSMFKLTGHRLGALIAGPAVLLGWSTGLHRAYLRHVGLMPNGQPSLYPGYVEDATPYIVKHRVSDRRAELPQIATPTVMLDDATKAAYLAGLTNKA